MVGDLTTIGSDNDERNVARRGEDTAEHLFKMGGSGGLGGENQPKILVRRRHQALHACSPLHPAFSCFAFRK
jgi:hypothetical protein